MSIANPPTQHDEALHAVEAALGDGQYADGTHRWLALSGARQIVLQHVGCTEPRARRLLGDLIDRGELVATGSSIARRVTLPRIAAAERQSYEETAARLDRIADRLDELGIDYSERIEGEYGHPALGLRRSVSMRWEAIEQLLALHDAAVEQ